VASAQRFADSQLERVKGKSVRFRETRTPERIIVVDHSEVIGTIHCQGRHVAKSHHFADSQSEEVKEQNQRIHEEKIRERITVVDCPDVIRAIHFGGTHGERPTFR
jgi:hypothetical protein